MENKSLWLDGIEEKNIKELNKNIKCDVLIIGGGMTGLNTAYFLSKSKLKVCLVEQGRIGLGVSSRTTGKINYLQETIYSDLEKYYNFDVAKMYLKSQRAAIRKIKSIIKKEKIECDLDKVTSYVFTDDKDEISKIEDEKYILKKMGIKVKEYEKLDIDLKCKYAISVDDTYVFHPVKYMYGLKRVCQRRGIKIYENTRVQNIKKVKNGYLCFTDKYEIRTKKVIVASHYPFFLKPYMMPLKVYTEKSYVTASLVDEYKNETMITNNLPCKSIRYHKDDNKNYMIYLSNSHNLCNDINAKKNINSTIREAKYLDLNPSYIWTNDDIMTVDKMPYIGRFEKKNNRLLIGTGYNTWGMTNSVLAGMILSDMILKKKNEYEKLFDPLRVNVISDIDSYLTNIGSSMKSFIQNKIVKNKKWYPESVSFEIRNGKNVAIYNDGEKEHIVLSNCPHMGCTLLFNEGEKTWDCPCHASRFDIDGKCIKGPSRYDISVNDIVEDEEL